MRSSITSLSDLLLICVGLTYLTLVGSYLILQVRFAERGRRAQPLAGGPAVSARSAAVPPSVDVVVPCYNEAPGTLAGCLSSIKAQDYQGKIRVFVVDDGSPNRAALDPVYAEYRAQPGFRLIELPENRGKRQAQVAAITSSDGDIVIAVDSDTMIASDGVRQLVAGLDEPGVGAAMGEMLAANAQANWLTRLIDMRYWYACNQERAAQSAFGAVLCCCGPFSAYRRSILEKVLDKYVNHTFWRRRSTYGEDRHLTNLVLCAGMRTTYVPSARARTVVPERLRPFLRQQLRWNRCTYRDMLGIARRLPALGGFLVLDAFVQIFAPALLGLLILLLLVRGAMAGFGGISWYLASLPVVAVAYCGYGIWRNRDPRFIGFVLYGLLHVVLLIPVRVKALFTLTDDRWGRRAVPESVIAKPD